MKMKEAVILDSIRTPIGKYNGQLSDFTAVELGASLVQKLLERNNIAGKKVNSLIFGSVVTAGQGQNIARQISVNAGLPVEVPAMTINEVCGSGMKTAILARQAILLGEAEVVVAGGVEKMSGTPVVTTDDAGNPVQAFMKDGLLDAFSGDLMGHTVEIIAENHGISREEMDEFALNSHQKALIARENHKFDRELMSIGEAVIDQGPRPDTSLEKLAQLRTAYKADGKLTAGNSSPVNDGGTALLLASRDFADEHQLEYLSIIKATSEIGVAPENMGISPIKAIRELLEKTELTIDDIDLFEINEAFAASSIVINRELGIPSEKVNIYGGSIALGHPLGSTGARLLGTLSYQLVQENKHYGVASLCIGGGLGLAVLLENAHYGK